MNKTKRLQTIDGVECYPLSAVANSQNLLN